MLEVVIIGAGLSGLICARRLVARGLEVRVLEARARVGGRLLSGRLAGSAVDLGGQWLSAGQERLLGLLGELGLGTFEQARARLPILDEPVAGFFGELGRALAQLRAMRRIERLAQRSPARERPALDRESLAAYLARSVPDPVVRARIALHAELVLASSLSEVSLLSYLSTMRATGGFGMRAPELPGGGREHRIRGGAQSIALSLAAALGERVVLGAPVRAIEQHAGHVVVHGEGRKLEARRVVVALPPAALRGVALELPPDVHALLMAANTGAVIKCFAAYERPFWRDRTAVPEVYRPAGLARATVEATTPGEAPALLSFVVGSAARQWAQRSRDERRAAVLEELALRLGPEAAEPVDYVEHDWAAEPYSAGCVTSHGPGALASGVSLGQALARVHFAGTETAVRWPGYMDGAIEAGERAASEVAAALAGARA